MFSGGAQIHRSSSDITIANCHPLDARATVASGTVFVARGYRPLPCFPANLSSIRSYIHQTFSEWKGDREGALVSDFLAFTT
jgi:hypothetical protein